MSAEETPWLQRLEGRVADAAAEIRRLRDANLELASTARELEQQIAAAGGDEEAAGWAEERAKIRRRVEGLAESLEALLDES